MEKLATAFSAIEPFIDTATAKATQLWKKIEPYHPLDWSLVIFGLLCCFVGGDFVTLIAAVEAFRMAGWSNMQKNLNVLYENYKIALDASHKDDEVDEDHDGIQDVKQISKKQLVKRKFRVVVASVSSNIDELTGALSAINAGVLAVIATLRVQFAQAITLGSSIGGIFATNSKKYVEPILRGAVPAEYHKWVPTILDYLARAMGISIAWFILRIIATFHSALRGGQMLTQGLVKQAKKRGYLKEDVEEGDQLFSYISMGVAGLGFLFQVWFGGLPFPLWVPFTPLYFMEYMLVWVINDPTAATQAIAG